MSIEITAAGNIYNTFKKPLTIVSSTFYVTKLPESGPGPSDAAVDAMVRIALVNVKFRCFYKVSIGT